MVSRECTLIFIVSNCNLASPPNPLPPRGRGDKLLLLLELSADIQLKSQQEKVTYPPPPWGEGVRERGQIAVYLNQKT